MRQIIFGDKREKISPQATSEAFDIQEDQWQTLPAGDYLSVDPKNMIEIKIKNDSKNLNQLQSELTKMNYGIYDSWVKHLLIVLPGATIAEYQRFVTMGYRSNTYTHLCKSIEEMIEKMKKIFSGFYEKPLNVVKHTKGLSDLAKLFAVIEGVSAEKASELAAFYNEDFNFFRNCNLDKADLTVSRVFGTKKDGSMKKIGEKILRRFGLV